MGRSSRRGWLRAALLLAFMVALCTLESLVVDFRALDMDVGRIFMYADERRIALILAAGALLCLCLPRFIFIVFVLFQFVSHLFILTYMDNMANAPFVISMAGGWQAALSVGVMNMLTFISVKHVLILLLTLALKLFLLQRYYRRPLRFKARMLIGVAALALIVSFHAHLYKRMDISIFKFPASGIMAHNGQVLPGSESFIARYMAGQVGLAYTWLGEVITDSYKNIDLPALSQLADVVGDRLPMFELPRTIVMIQVESLDLCLLGLEKNEQLVMPFLTGLEKQSILAPVKMQRKVGSANSDFEVFSGNPAIFPLIYYSFLPKSAYKDFLITKINQLGYDTIAVVNDPAAAFYTGEAYKAMEFGQAHFLEEIAAKYGREYLDDRDDQKLIDYAISQINSDRTQFLFLITMSMHPPFFGSGSQFGRSGYNELFHSTAYDVDNAFSRLYQALPQGALLFIWGDHPSGSNIIKSLPCDNKIPLLINIKGQDISDHAWQGAPLDSLYEVGIYLRRLFSQPPLPEQR